MYNMQSLCLEVIQEMARSEIRWKNSSCIFNMDTGYETGI